MAAYILFSIGAVICNLQEMTKELVKLAKKAAKEQNLVYAPDMEAMIWMQRFSEMITITERERCARLAESWDLNLLAEAIREKP